MSWVSVGKLTLLYFIFQQVYHRVDPVNISGHVSVEPRVAPTPRDQDKTPDCHNLHLPLAAADDTHHGVSVLMGTHQRSSGILLENNNFYVPK